MFSQSSLSVVRSCWIGRLEHSNIVSLIVVALMAELAFEFPVFPLLGFIAYMGVFVPHLVDPSQSFTVCQQLPVLRDEQRSACGGAPVVLPYMYALY